jgi:4'-phosphopantetheinyl transferase EntD
MIWRGKIIVKFGNMPIFFQQDIDECTKLGVWKIEEDEEFFLAQVPLQREITHPHKRLQHLAGRYLLQWLYPDFPTSLIRIADTRKPFLENEAYHFSISHCALYAAVMVSTQNRVGVDVEVASEKIERIQHKFLSADEQTRVRDHRNTTEGLTLAWSCKEAVFKWYGLGGVDFKDHMEIRTVIPSSGTTSDTIILFKKNEDLFLDLHSYFFNDLCLSYVFT